MTAYSQQARHFLKKIDALLADRLLHRIALLAENPFPPDCKRMQGEKHLFRIRVGHYRIIYKIKNELLITEINKRENIY